MQEKIHLYKTQEEWDAIDEKIKLLGRKDFKGFLRSEIFKLNNKFEEDSACIIGSTTNEKVERQPFISELEISQLRRISARTKKSINCVVNEYILIPLLLPDKV